MLVILDKNDLDNDKLYGNVEELIKPQDISHQYFEPCDKKL